MKRLLFTLLLACSLIALPCYSNEGATQETEKQEKKSKKAKKEKMHEEHVYVDLGLPSGTLWATCNVGAENPWEYGNYYAWCEPYTKSEYTEENSQTDGKELGDISGNPAYDVACKEWGGKWRMPTKAELEELKNYCTWEWTTQNNINGYKVTSKKKKKNNNSIFLPAAGYYDGLWFKFVDYGFYWSSSPIGGLPGRASSLSFHKSVGSVGWSLRYLGLPVRPVVKL